MELHFLPYGRVDAILIGDRSRWVFTAGARGDGRVTARFKDGTCHIETTK
jgi:hypothetical protein